MANSDDFRKEVQGSVHKLLSGHKDKTPGKLVAEGVVEGFKLYRSYKEEKSKEGKSKGREQHHNRRHHSRRDRSTEGHPGRSRQRHGDQSHRKHRDRSRERQRERSVSRDRGQSEEQGSIPDPVIETHTGEDQRYMMSGGIGPADSHNLPYRSYAHDRHRTPSPAADRPRHSENPQQNRNRSRQRSRSGPGHRNSSPPPSHTSTSHSRVGPDGTLFGDLPKYKMKKGLALGFGNHVVNTYKHIKAEHDAGHRSKGMLEKKMDEIRGKKVNVRDVRTIAVSQYRGHRRVRKERSGRDEQREERRGGSKRRDDRAVRETKEVLEAPNPSDQSEVQATPRGTRETSPSPPDINLIPPTARNTPPRSSQVIPEIPHEQTPPALAQPQPSSFWNELGSRRLSVESYDSHTSHETSESEPGEETSYYGSSPQGPESTEVSPLRSSFDQPPSPVYPMSQAFEIPSRSPPPPTTAPPQHNPPISALLGAIQGGLKLKKVDKSEIRDNSAAKAGRPLYESTPHSHDVEERERAQEGGWSTDDEAGPQSYTAPDRGFQDELARKLDGE